jgi:hypothetical protein
MLLAIVNEVACMMRFVAVHNQKTSCILLITLTEAIKMLDSLQRNSVV